MPFGQGGRKEGEGEEGDESVELHDKRVAIVEYGVLSDGRLGQTKVKSRPFIRFFSSMGTIAATLSWEPERAR